MRRESWPVAKSAGLSAILMGVLVILGWITDTPMLKSLLPGFQTMKVNTALMFIMVGWWLLKPNVWLPWILGVFATILFIQSPLGLDFGLDQLLIADQGGGLYPGRPAQPTAFAFMVMAVAMARPGRVSQWLLHGVTLLGFVSILGYLTNEPELYTIASATSMSIPASVGLLVLSIGVAFYQPNLGLLGAFTGTGLGARAAREMAPALIGFVLLSEGMRVILLRAGYTAEGFGSALQILAIVVFVLFLIRRVARQLNASDSEIRSLNRNLERKVADRTAELQRKNAQLLDFTHIISHNLRAPVANLVSIASMRNALSDPHELDELQAMQDQVVHNLRTTLDDLTNALKVQQSRDLNTEPLEFASMLDTVAANLSGIIRAESAELTSDFGAAPVVVFNRFYLESILQNLVGNALKYRHPDRKPTIHLRSHHEGDSIILSVTDNGVGMDLARHGAKLFGFGKTFHDHPDAKGIGLYMTRSQLEALGGHISAESEVGMGTTFRLVFPASA